MNERDMPEKEYNEWSDQLSYLAMLDQDERAQEEYNEPTFKDD